MYLLNSSKYLLRSCINILIILNEWMWHLFLCLCYAFTKSKCTEATLLKQLKKVVHLKSQV